MAGIRGPGRLEAGPSAIHFVITRGAPVLLEEDLAAAPFDVAGSLRPPKTLSSFQNCWVGPSCPNTCASSNPPPLFHSLQRPATPRQIVFQYFCLTLDCPAPPPHNVGLQRTQAESKTTAYTLAFSDGPSQDMRRT